MAALQNVQGTWGIGGFKIPDFGLTELISASRGTTSNPTYNNPKVYQAVGGVPTAQNTSTVPWVQPGGYTTSITPGQVQGVSTQNTGGSSGGNSGGSSTPVNDPNAPQQGWGQTFPNMDAYNQYRDQMTNEINTGYNNYFSQLDSMLNSDLPAQRSSQEGVARSQGTQAENTLGAQRTQGLADLATQTRQTEQGQAKSLQSLADDVRNQFKAGQIYLGSRGAGDSSAANQYSYAIAKMGNQARGNVMQQTNEIKNQIADREFKLNNTYNTELNNIKESVNQKVLEIGNWFSDAQMKIKEMKANGELAKGKDLANMSSQLLQTATQQLLMAQQEGANRRSMLDSWAASNSKTIGELRTNLAGISNYQAPGVTNPGVSGQLSSDSQGNVAYNRTPGTGYGYSTKVDKDIYGNPLTGPVTWG